MRILIIKPSSLGDVVHALPALQALRHRWPAAEIHWLVKHEWAGLLERAEGLDHIWRIERGWRGWPAAVSQLRAARFDLVLDLQGLLRSGVTARLTGCRRRIGFADAREGSPLFYTERVQVPTADMHAVDRYLVLSARAGAPVPDKLEFRLCPTSDDRDQVSAMLRRHGLAPGTPWIAMNPAARWLTKRWPSESFAQVADEIHTMGLARVVLIGSEIDRPAADAVKNAMRTAPLDLTGATGLQLLPALLASSALLVTNDSGPMHVAAAMGTPVVALFGPTSAVRTGPYGAGHTVLSSAVACRPCFSRRCRNAVQLECLTAITPDRVLNAIVELLKVQGKAEREMKAGFHIGS